MKHRVLTLVGALGLVAFASAGCAQEEPKAAEVPVGWSQIETAVPEEIMEFGAAFIPSGETTDVFLGGSSSCEPLIESAVVDDKGALVIDLEKYPEDRACTTDLVFYTYQFDAPATSVTVNDPNTDTKLKLIQFE